MQKYRKFQYNAREIIVFFQYFLRNFQIVLKIIVNQQIRIMKRTSEHQDEIRNRIKLIIDEKELTQKQFSDISCIAQGDISKYLNGKNTLADSFIYTIILKFSINPRWLEFGEFPMYLSPNVEQNNANSGNGTQINNVNGDNNVNMTMPKEAWEMLQSQQKTIESQQDSVKMAQVNMMELIKAFNK